MRDYERHPEPTAPDLGVLCLRAVTLDGRFDPRVRRQAERLLALSGHGYVLPEDSRDRQGGLSH